MCGGRGGRAAAARKGGAERAGERAHVRAVFRDEGVALLALSLRVFLRSWILRAARQHQGKSKLGCTSSTRAMEAQAHGGERSAARHEQNVRAVHSTVEDTRGSKKERRLRRLGESRGFL